MGIQLVWLKRDLRLSDHAPLWEASQRGPCLVLYIYEDELLQSPEFDASHLAFINASLAEIREGLRARGAELLLRRGEATAVLEAVYRERPFDAIWSHMETGNALTYARDLRVKGWAASRNLPWHERKQNGVVRRLRSRDGWAKRWTEQMAAPVLPSVSAIRCPGGIDGGPLLFAEDLGLPRSHKPEAKPGGESHAHQELETFLSYRGVNYRKDMSSPLAGWEGCSRISPYLAWGNLSMRQVYHSLRRRTEELRCLREEGIAVDGRWFGSLQSFGARLRWHCHFMQKLEDEPEIEFRNMARVYDGLRENDFDEARFQAWCEGRTGYPMVDACMRALHAGGWINFRMRAMLVSFASYHLWLHWRPTAVYLAKQFLDFEPGIHFSQFQMQSGVTGINTVRIYSPAKQVTDQDPNGVFIRRYVPELSGVPEEYLAEPHSMPPLLQQSVGCVVGKHYPVPVVDYRQATKLARERLWAVRKRAEAKTEAKRVYKKHGSRRRPGAFVREDRNT